MQGARLRGRGTGAGAFGSAEPAGGRGTRGTRPDWGAYDTIAASSDGRNPKRPRARGKQRGGVRASTHLAHSARGDVAKHFTRVVPVRGVARGSASRARPLGFFRRSDLEGRRKILPRIQREAPVSDPDGTSLLPGRVGQKVSDENVHPSALARAQVRRDRRRSSRGSLVGRARSKTRRDGL